MVPGKILVFPQTTYETLPASATWKDTVNGRQFSSAFYAELLQYLKVNIVFKDELSIVDEEAFEGESIDIENLDFRHENDLLRQSDRLINVARHSSSVLAFQKCAQGERVFTTLLITLLIRLYGFQGRAALAWLSMVLQS